MAISFVTGAGGFVGANLVRALLQRGDTVHCLIRPQGDVWRLADCKDRLTFHKIQLGHDKQSVVAAIESSKPDYVFHLAHYGGNRGQANGAEIRSVIIEGTAHLYEACMNQSSIKAIINAGSSSEYGIKSEPMREDMLAAPVSEYGIAKLWATLYGEHIRREKNMPISTLRLFSVYGSYEASTRLIPAVTLAFLRDTLPNLSNPQAVLDLVHVDDVVDALMIATEKPKGVYNIGTGIQTSLKDIVAMIQSSLANHSELVWGGDPGRGSEVQTWRADMTHTQDVFGWVPRISVAEGIHTTVEWFKAHKNIYG